MSEVPPNNVLTYEELCQILDDYHKWRWRAIGAWAIIFSLLVAGVLWATKHEADARRNDRSVQISAIVSAGHQECIHSFQAMSQILRTSITPARMKRLDASEKKRIRQLFTLADPKTNCPPSTLSAGTKKVLHETTTANEGA